MRYLSIYLNSKLLTCIDLKKPNRADVMDAIYYVDKFDVLALESSYKNVFKAEFRRTAEHQEPTSSRVIHWCDVPKRLSKEQLLTKLEDLLKRGKDKDKRKMNPRSLANLKPGKRFTSDQQPSKPRKLSDAELDHAEQLKANGCSWPQVGDRLRVNYQTVRSSLRRRGVERAKLAQEIKPLTGLKTQDGYSPTGAACSHR